MSNVVNSYGRLAQLVEHSLDVRVVSGSSPLTSTKNKTALRLSYFFIQSAGLVGDFALASM